MYILVILHCIKKKKKDEKDSDGMVLMAYQPV